MHDCSKTNACVDVMFDTLVCCVCDEQLYQLSYSN